MLGRPSSLLLGLGFLIGCASGESESPGSGGSGAGAEGGASSSANAGGSTRQSTSTSASSGPGGGGAGGATAASSSSSASASSSGSGGAPPLAEVYAHSDTVLFVLDPIAKTVTTIGTFDCAQILIMGSGEGMWDIALDKNGNMVGSKRSYANGDALVTIDKGNAHCAPIAAGSYPNSLTFVAEGILDPNQEVLVGYDQSTYQRIDPTNGAVTVIGDMNPNATGQDWESSGDIVSLIGGQTYLTVKPFGSGSGYAGTDTIVEIDPVTGKPSKIIGDTTYPKLWGLGYWSGVAYGFSATGQLISIDLGNASASGIPLMMPNLSFWGAGVTTSAPHI